MSYFGPIWKSLKFNTGSATSQLGSSLNYRIRMDNSDLVYRNPRYKSVLVHIAKQLAMSTLEGELQKIMPKFRKKVYDDMKNAMRQKQHVIEEALIERRKIQSESWGKIITSDGKEIVAKNRYGQPVKEALMLYYTTTDTNTIQEMTYDETGNTKTTEIQTKDVCHIDLQPRVSMSSSKNVVMTPVQGRDYTRKELVSGGDLRFTVSGTIVSNDEYIYPTNAVQKLKQILQYNGIVNVNFFAFNQFNVDKIIVLDYSFGEVVCKNEQPYSFTCVAVEPDEDVRVLTDTISIIQEQLKGSELSGWYKFILENKLGQMLTTAVTNTATGLATQGAGMGLDKLAPNI